MRVNTAKICFNNASLTRSLCRVCSRNYMVKQCQITRCYRLHHYYQRCFDCVPIHTEGYYTRIRTVTIMLCPSQKYWYSLSESHDKITWQDHMLHMRADKVSQKEGITSLKVWPQTPRKWAQIQLILILVDLTKVFDNASCYNQYTQELYEPKIVWTIVSLEKVYFRSHPFIKCLTE